MSYGAAIVTLLNADSTLTALLTGGIYEFEYSGRKGLNRIEVVQAYVQKTGLLKPLCIIYEAAAIDTGEVHSPSTGRVSTITPITGWIYDQGDSGYGTIASAEQRIYHDLAFTRLTGALQILWGQTIKDKREPLLEDAGYFQFECRVHGWRTS
jgi:hypothetical protein